MNRREVIEELEYYQKTHLTLAERMGRLIQALKAPPAAQPEQSAPTEPERPASDFVVQESDGRDEWKSPAQRGVVDFRGDPLAKSMNDLVTPKQLGMIKALAREARVDYDAECLGQLKCHADELSKRAASAFIDYLKGLQEQGAEFRKVG